MSINLCASDRISIRRKIYKYGIEFRRNGTYKTYRNAPFLWNSKTKLETFTAD
jgi:hypothetical protein